MEIVFIMSQEHQTLPRAEIDAVLRAEKIVFSFKNQYDGILMLEIDNEHINAMEKVGKRLSYTHELCKLVIETDKTSLKSDVEKVDWKEIIKNDYVVRARRMDKTDKFDTSKVEIEIGGTINKMVEGSTVNLKDPECFLRLIYLDGIVLVTQRLLKIDKKHFNNFKPHKRPFFYPGSMSPKLARCMVNLTEIEVGDTVLDPFCGTGGILIEAGILGAKLVGADIDYKMVEGTKSNLEYCGFKDPEIFKEDARNIHLDIKVNAIVTDPPYGISASTGGENSTDLYSGALRNMDNLLLETGKICMATPHYMDIKGLIKDTNFEIIEQHHIRMHKSLTRVISLLTKII
jgi:tRNA (guanine10-N2)-dimethyltransferase